MDHIVTADKIRLNSYTLLKQVAEKPIQETAAREISEEDPKSSSKDRIIKHISFMF